MTACSDGPPLLAAAVRAAILAKAPRRTVSSMAAAMVCALHGKRPPTTQQPRAQAEAVGTELEGLGGASPEALLQALRATRSQQRKRKKMRGKANRAAREAAAMNVDDGQASPQPVPDIVPTSAGDDQEPGDGGAGLQLANALELQDMEAVEQFGGSIR